MCVTVQFLNSFYLYWINILAYTTRAQFYITATRWQQISTVAGASVLSGTGMTQLCVKFDYARG